MKKKKNQKSSKPQTNISGRPTLLEFMASYQVEAVKVLGLPVKVETDLQIYPMPTWAIKVLVQLRKTVMKTVLKLKPGTSVNCQHYGKLIGVLERQITFFQVDVWRIAEEEGWEKISDEDWEKIQPRAQLRAQLVKFLNRPVAEEETLDELVIEAVERKIEDLEKIKRAALQFISNQNAKDRILFFKGMAQGIELFLDEHGKFCGDRGRTEIYLELLSSQYEIEKMRRVLPPRKDSDLYEHLKPWYRFPNGREEGAAWLRKVCDDISLYMTGKRGRPPGTRPAPVF